MQHFRNLTTLVCVTNAWPLSGIDVRQSTVGNVNMNFFLNDRTIMVACTTVWLLRNLCLDEKLCLRYNRNGEHQIRMRDGSANTNNGNIYSKHVQRYLYTHQFVH